jgi:hypothetical protein
MYCLGVLYRSLDFSRPWAWVYLVVVLGLATYAYFRSTKRREVSPAVLAQPDPGWHPPDELAGPVPRPVHVRPKVVRGIVFIGILTAVPVFLLAAVGVSAAEFYFHEKDVSIIYLGVSLIFFLLTAGVAALYVKTFNGPRNLLKWGKPAKGIVMLTRKPDAVGVVLDVKYQFMDSPGNLIHGKSQVRAPVGDVITVLYDPKNPKRNCGYLVPAFELSSRGN